LGAKGGQRVQACNQKGQLANETAGAVKQEMISVGAKGGPLNPLGHSCRAIAVGVGVWHRRENFWRLEDVGLVRKLSRKILAGESFVARARGRRSHANRMGA